MTAYHGEILKAEDFQGQHFSHHLFEDCTFLPGDYSQVEFSFCTLRDCTFSRAMLREACFPESKLQQVRFEECKLTDINFKEVNPIAFELTFDKCKLEYCTFAGLIMNGFQFGKSEIIACNFWQCKIGEANFYGCNLKESQFENCTLKQTDFRDAQHYHIDPTQNQLKGARFSLPDALVFLRHFGIKVE